MKVVKVLLFGIFFALSIGTIAKLAPTLEQQLKVLYEEEWLLPKFLKNLNLRFKNRPQEAVEFLMIKDNSGWDLLHYYVTSEHTDEVETVLEYIKNLYDENKSLALKQDIFELINARDNDGRTILHNALLRKNTTLVKMILSFFKKMFGKNKDYVEAFFLDSDNFGWTPLHVSTRNDDFENTRLLLRRAERLMNAQQFLEFINAEDNEGDRPYDYARPSGRTLLKELGAEVTESSEIRN